VFLFNVPCCVVIIALMSIAWPYQSNAGRITWRQLDIVGCLLCAAGSVLFMFALQEAGAGAYAWSSATIIASIVTSGIAALALAAWIWYLSAGTRMFAPLFQGRLLRNRVLGANTM